MQQADSIFELIRHQGLVPLFYHQDLDSSLEIMKALYEGGLRSLEYTRRGSAALENFQALVRYRDRYLPDLVLGTGTVMDGPSAHTFLEAGAAFLVSPGLFPSVGKEASLRDALWIPGCMSPTEIAQAIGLGARMVKIFPARVLSPDFLRNIRDIFPETAFIATGSMETGQDHLKSFFEAGAQAVGIGSHLIQSQWVKEKQWSRISELASRTLEIIRTIRKA